MEDLDRNLSVPDFQAQRIAYNLPMVQDLIENKTKLDAVIFTPVTNDVGIYLAREVFDAPIIYFFIGETFTYILQIGLDFGIGS